MAKSSGTPFGQNESHNIDLEFIPSRPVLARQTPKVPKARPRDKGEGAQQLVRNFRLFRLFHLLRLFRMWPIQKAVQGRKYDDDASLR